MRSLLLDELKPHDVERVRAFLHRAARPSSIDDLFWIELDDSLLTPLQAEHHECQPHRFAVEVGSDYVRLEMLVRPSSGLRCDCCQYADNKQQGFLLELADKMVTQLEIKT